MTTDRTNTTIDRLAKEQAEKWAADGYGIVWNQQRPDFMGFGRTDGEATQAELMQRKKWSR